MYETKDTPHPAAACKPSSNPNTQPSRARVCVCTIRTQHMHIPCSPARAVSADAASTSNLCGLGFRLQGLGFNLGFSDVSAECP